MANTLQLKQGLEVNRTNITPISGEPIWVTDTHKLYIGDGVTPGGISVTEGLDSVFIQLTEKASPNGVATLDAAGKIPSAQLPPIEIGHVYVVDTLSEMFALTNIQTGDVCIVTGTTTPSEKGTYVASSTSNPSTDPIPTSDWIEMAQPDAPVQSVNGKTGVVSLTTDDVAEGLNLYFTDARAQTSANIVVQNTIDDTAGTGDVNLLWSADKINSEIQNSVITTFSDLLDTDVRLPQDGDCIQYSAFLGKWVNTPPQDITFTLGELTNVNSAVDNANDSEVIIRNGTEFINRQLNGQDVLLTNYLKPIVSSPIIASDTVNDAIGKLETGVEEAKASAGDPNVQSDWLQTDITQDDYIKNKPDLSALRLGDLANVPEFAADNSDANKLLSVDLTGQTVEFINPNNVGRTSLVALDDTNISSSVDGQVLTWSSSLSKWINQDLPTTITTLVGLTDTPSTYGTPGALLQVNATQTGFEYTSVIDGGTF